MKYAGIIFILFSLFSCQERKSTELSDRRIHKKKMKVMVIQPFAGFPAELADSLFVDIMKINPNVTLNQPIPLPDMAYNNEKNRYRADSLISFLWRKSNSIQVVIGLTEKDISTTKGKISDWGIMGLAYRPGYSCVVSTYRLSKKNTYSQFYKLSLHELAHTEGLPHCRRDSSCYMSDANGQNPWDAETGFCHYCKMYLKYKGWQLN